MTIRGSIFNRRQGVNFRRGVDKWLLHERQLESRPAELPDTSAEGDA